MKDLAKGWRVARLIPVWFNMSEAESDLFSSPFLLLL
jgi:hypothetical protein